MTEQDFTPYDPSGGQASPPVPPDTPPEPPRTGEAPVLHEKKKSRTGVFFLGAFSGCLIVFVGLMFFVFAMAAKRQGGTTDFKFSTNKIAIVPIEGEILESRDIIEALHRHADNSMVKAMVVRINSPGGAIAPSQEIYSEIRKIRQRTGKPIVASMDSVAASGGFYIAVACNEIVANPGSITGSIGVILQWMDLEDLVRWAKMKPETITSGTMKAAGSPYREMSDAERQYFQRIVLQLHDQFVRAVADGRKGKISGEEVARLADGRVFTGEEAHQLKLVDKLGNLDDAVRVAARLAGVRGEPSTLYPRRRQPTLIDLLTNNDAESMMEWVVNRKAARFLYRW
jgi:protease IV